MIFRGNFLTPLVCRYYDTESHCSSEFVGLFGYLSINACVPVDQSGGGTLRVTNCGTNGYEVNMYSDQYCEDLEESGSGKLLTCATEEPSDEFSPVSFVTYSCQN